LAVFGLQVAMSSDFTAFFLVHPELMDIATLPSSSSAVVDADAKASQALSSCHPSRASRSSLRAP
jgi:hypothetical protein